MDKYREFDDALTLVKQAHSMLKMRYEDDLHAREQLGRVKELHDLMKAIENSISNLNKAEQKLKGIEPLI